LARLAEEISRDYVYDFLDKAHRHGLGLVNLAEDGETILGEIHSYSPALFCFSHVLSDLTICVSPRAQGQGTGRALFEALMQSVIQTRPEFTRVELIVRESNRRAIALYQSLGFVVEGKFAGRIKNVDGSFEADIPMAWNR